MLADKRPRLRPLGCVESEKGTRQRDFSGGASGINQIEQWAAAFSLVFFGIFTPAKLQLQSQESKEGWKI